MDSIDIESNGSLNKCRETEEYVLMNEDDYIRLFEDIYCSIN